MIVIERLLETLVFLVALRAAMGLVRVPWFSDGWWAAVRTAVRGRPFPVVAALVTTLLVAGAVTELAWPGVVTALGHQPGGPWWQDLTAPFVQGNGIAGTLFNIVSAALVLTAAQWYAGRVVAALVWLVGAWVPTGAVDELIGYHVSAENVVAYSSGSSGATYFAVGALCVAAALTRTAVGVRLAGLGALAIAAVMWLAVNDGHGVVLLQGAVLGLVVFGARALRRRAVRPAGDPTGCTV